MESLVPHPDEPTMEQAIAGISPSQQKFISDPSRFAALVGGWRAGKSVAGCLNMLLFAKQNPGQYLIGRWNLPALEITTKRAFLAMCPKDWATHQKQAGIVTLKSNGSQFLFRHLDVPDLHQHLRSLNLRGFLVDEASEANEKVFMMLVGRLSSGATRIGRVTSNPEGHNWVWSRFFNPNRAPRWKQMYSGYVVPTEENKNLPADYIQDLKDTLPEDWYERYVNSSFAEFSDLVYKEWDTNKHVYDPTMSHEFFGGRGDPPEEWPCYIGLDIGGIDPWAFSFWRFAPNGMAFKFAEIHQAGVFVSELADLYFKALGNSNFQALAYDYENQQAALELTRYNINGGKAIKEVKPGIFTLSYYLHINPNFMNPFTGKMGSPMAFVSSACENTIREYSSYKWAKDRTGKSVNYPQDGDDHQVSADRYMFHTFHPVGIPKLTLPSWENPELDEASRLYWYEVHKNEEKQKRFRKHPFSGRHRSFLRSERKY